MVFKIKPILTPRQLRRSKFTFAFVATVLTLIGLFSTFVDAEGDKEELTWNQEKWLKMDVEEYPRGRIVYFSKNSEVCQSILLLPGLALLSRGTLAVMYGLCLCYLFIGISIVAEIFMEAIEKITSKQEIVTVEISPGNEREQKVLFWNATVANLTLMALGSSAPEILLAVLETVQNLGKCPGELGASTIVGSASFNLLVISGLCIYAVSEEQDNDPERDDEVPKGVKRIYDLRVFAITCTSSLFAYIWLWYCLLDQEVSLFEGVLTFVFFFILVIMAYGADKWTAMEAERLKGSKVENEVPVIKYSACEIYKDLIIEARGDAPLDDQSVEKRSKMKHFLKATVGTDQIENVDLDQLKKIVEGESMISRIKYKKMVNNSLTGKRPVIAKFEKIKLEHAYSKDIDEGLKNKDFGFTCLHYSVSESQGILSVQVQNKTLNAGSVFAQTIDGEAVANDDYIPFNGILDFKKGEKNKTIDIKIIDDDDWEPDEDFFVQLYDPRTRQELLGHDTRTKITIIDDDKPGQLCFRDNNGVKVQPTAEYAEVVVNRKNGNDGIVFVDYFTKQLGEGDEVAKEGKHYEATSGTLVFEHQQNQQTIKIKLLPFHIEDGEEVDFAFGVQLTNEKPKSKDKKSGVKLSRKTLQNVNIVTNIDQKKKADAYAQLIAKLEQEEAKTWGSQFVTACMLHPTKGEDGEIQDIEFMDGAFHFATIAWKLVFAFIPPAHYYGGIPCFFISLTFIGFVTWIVGEFANLFGCVLGVKPGVTAITFVALGTSLPDTFASMQAAQQEKYADAAVGNVTGSNSVNVFLGLGLPWVIACTYEHMKFGENYYVPAGSLGFSVVVFIACAVLCVITLILRRIKVGGELGGGPVGRLGSAVFLCSLWLVYITMSILQAYEIGGAEAWEGLRFGIKAGVKCPQRYLDLKKK